MLNCSASLAMSTSVLKAFPGKLDIKRHSPSILYIHGWMHGWIKLVCSNVDLKDGSSDNIKRLPTASKEDFSDR